MSRVSESDIQATITTIKSSAVQVLLGGLLTIFIKSCKYVAFDTAKERTFIPLSYESKSIGKAGIDTIGSKVGKALPSGFNSVVVGAVTGGVVLEPWAVYLDISSYNAAVFFLVSVLGFIASLRLNDSYSDLVVSRDSQNKEDQYLEEKVNTSIENKLDDPQKQDEQNLRSDKSTTPIDDGKKKSESENFLDSLVN
jgi:ATP/ADP translocase